MAVYELEDMEALAAKHPDDFPIPTRAERESLEPADTVQLEFSAGESGECLRAIVIHRRSDWRYLGSITSKPQIIRMEFGDPVLFGPEHVLAIEREVVRHQRPASRPGRQPFDLIRLGACERQRERQP